METFSTHMEFRIDWSEVDSFGHVNNLAIMRYVQSARVHYLESIGMMQWHLETGLGPVLASISCQFKRQLHYPGRVRIQSRVDQVNHTSFHMRHLLLDEAGERVGEAHDVLVMFDFQRQVKLPVPEPFRGRMLPALAIESI